MTVRGVDRRCRQRLAGRFLMVDRISRRFSIRWSPAPLRAIRTTPIYFGRNLFTISVFIL